MAKQPHPFDSVADEIKDYLTSESQYYINAIVGDYQSPFAANVSPKDMVEYYRRNVYMQNPDGTPNYSQPNKEFRDALMQRAGVDGYAEVMKAVGTGPKPHSIVDNTGSF